MLWLLAERMQDVGNHRRVRHHLGLGPMAGERCDGFIPAFELKQNYPNPFNAGTRIRFSVLKPSYIELKIFDISGREITKLISGLQYNTGEYDYYFDPGKHSISSGIYFYTMKGSTTDNKEIFIETKKLMLVK